MAKFGSTEVAAAASYAKSMRTFGAQAAADARTSEQRHKQFAAMSFQSQNLGFKAYLASSSIQALTGSIERFTAPIDNVFQKIGDGVRMLGGVATQQFGKFVNLETSLLSASNELRLSVTKSKYDKTPIMGFDKSYELTEEMRNRAIKLATTLPGSNKNYQEAAVYTADLAGKSAKGDVSKVLPNWEKLTKFAGLIASTQKIDPSVVNTGMNQFMASGRLGSQSALGKNFQILKGMLNDPKMGAVGTEEQRIDKMMKLLPILYPAEVLSKFENTFDTRIANLQEQLTGETGIFSFSRKNSDGVNIGDRLKKIFDKIVPDLKPINKLVDTFVSNAFKFAEPIINRVGAMSKGAPERLSAMKTFSVSSVASALTGLTPAQNIQLIRDVFDWIRRVIKDIGSALNGGSSDPVTKAIVEGVQSVFKELAFQKASLAFNNAPALAMNDPLAALGVVSSLVQMGSSLLMFAAFFPQIATGFGVFVGGVKAAGLAVAGAAAAIAGSPALIVAGFAVAAVAALAAGYWLGTQIATNWESISKGFTDIMAMLQKGILDFIEMLNPVNVWQRAGVFGKPVTESTTAPPAAKVSSPSVSFTQPATTVFGGSPMVPGTKVPSSAKPASGKSEGFRQRASVDINVNDIKGTLNSVTKDNILEAIGTALNGFGALSASGLA